MEPFERERSTRRGLSTEASFRHQVRWQVYLPLGAGVLALVLAAGAGVWTGGLGAAQASAWADASLVFLLLPVMLMGLVALVVLAAAAFGIAWLVRWLPPRSRKVQRFTAQARQLVERAADLAVKPVVVPAAAWRAFREGIAGRR